MCLSLPVKILEFKNSKAIAEYMGKKETFDIDLIPNIKINDYALASNGFIIKKITAQEADEIFKIINPKKEEK